MLIISKYLYNLTIFRVIQCLWTLSNILIIVIWRERYTWDKQKITTGKNLAAKPLKTRAASSDGIVCCTYLLNSYWYRWLSMCTQYGIIVYVYIYIYVYTRVCVCTCNVNGRNAMQCSAIECNVIWCTALCKISTVCFLYVYLWWGESTLLARS